MANELISKVKKIKSENDYQINRHSRLQCSPIDIFHIKISYLLFFLFINLFFCGCVSSNASATNNTSLDSEKIERATQLIKSGKAECVLITDNKIFAQERGHGVNPLLFIYDNQRKNMAGGVIVDKVIGRAAATIAICGRVRHVHGELMSEDAIIYLQANGISVSYTKLVHRILNKKMDGLCPLEQSVYGITSPEKALLALRKKIASFNKR